MKVKKKAKSHSENSRPTGSSRAYYFAVAALILYIAFEVYGPALRGPFVYDDFSLPYYDPVFHTERFANWIHRDRPLLMLSYWINFQLSGRDPHWYHIFNLFFHLLNSVAVFLIARRLLALEVLDRWRREVLAVFAATLFLLHPLQTESVAWVAGRSESLSALFFLSAFALFLYRPEGAIRWARSLVILFLFACAVATKEHTAILPIVLVVTDYFTAREDRIGTIRGNWRLYLPMLLGGLLAGIFVWSVISTSQSAGFHGAGVSWLSYAFTQCRVFYMYLRLFVLPIGQNIDYDLVWSPARFDSWTFAGFLGIVTLAVFAWRLRRKLPVASYGILLLLILLAPTSSFIPIKDPIAERRLYLPIVGLALLACSFLIHSVKDRTTTVAVASLLIVAASIAAYRRNQLWGSEAALWEDTVAKSPNKLRGYGHLVHGLIREHHCREALQRLEEVSRRLPVDASLLGHWAVAYECVHEPEHAVAKLELAAAQAPSAARYLNIAKDQLELDRQLDAIQSLNRALEIDPHLESAYVMRGELYERQGDPSMAAHDYVQALQLDPTDEQARWRFQRMSRHMVHR